MRCDNWGNRNNSNREDNYNKDYTSSENKNSGYYTLKTTYYSQQNISQIIFELSGRPNHK